LCSSGFEECSGSSRSGFDEEGECSSGSSGFDDEECSSDGSGCDEADGESDTKCSGCGSGYSFYTGYGGYGDGDSDDEHRAFGFGGASDSCNGPVGDRGASDSSLSLADVVHRALGEL
jgi:hypothetical protein